ncbi:MAG: isopenicillin N synthase family oxygenase [Actinobacteria bacterium]|nr:isopenicillin N synthase family oxygenase [Actinomycetota bacterium]
MRILPIIDPNDHDSSDRIDAACRRDGFFAVPLEPALRNLRDEVIALAVEFFALPANEKKRVSMVAGGTAWRGWFPLGGELTSGVPDGKEGYYFGTEMPPDPRPLHGRNIWPARPAGLNAAVTEWMTAMESLGQRLLRLMARGLGQAADLFEQGLTEHPTALFRIFRYPPHLIDDVTTWGVGEHTDYGLLTLLATDGTPGLEVNSLGEWIPAPADADLLICNLGDMLDRLTGGRYRSTPHRVRNHSSSDRYSLPFFLDPGWDACVEPLSLADKWDAPADQRARWDRANLRDISGTYGTWLTAKVSKVFPDLASETIAD